MMTGGNWNSSASSDWSGDHMVDIASSDDTSSWNNGWEALILVHGVKTDGGRGTNESDNSFETVHFDFLIYT